MTRDSNKYKDPSKALLSAKFSEHIETFDPKLSQEIRGFNDRNRARLTGPLASISSVLWRAARAVLFS